MDNEDKARELTTRLFYVPAQIYDSWPFEVPNFAMDAQSCRKVVAAIAAGDERLRIVFERRVNVYLADIGWIDGWAMSLMALTPLVLVDIALASLGEVGR